MTITLRQSLNAKEVEAIQNQADPYSFLFSLDIIFYAALFEYDHLLIFPQHNRLQNFNL